MNEHTFINFIYKTNYLPWVLSFAANEAGSDAGYSRWTKMILVSTVLEFTNSPGRSASCSERNLALRWSSSKRPDSKSSKACNPAAAKMPTITLGWYKIMI